MEYDKMIPPGHPVLYYSKSTQTWYKAKVVGYDGRKMYTVEIENTQRRKSATRQDLRISHEWKYFSESENKWIDAKIAKKTPNRDGTIDLWVKVKAKPEKLKKIVKGKIEQNGNPLKLNRSSWLSSSELSNNVEELYDKWLSKGNKSEKYQWEQKGPNGGDVTCHLWVGKKPHYQKWMGDKSNFDEWKEGKNIDSNPENANSAYQTWLSTSKSIPLYQKWKRKSKQSSAAVNYHLWVSPQKKETSPPTSNALEIKKKLSRKSNIHTSRVGCIRLLPNDDLLKSIKEWAKVHNVSAGYIITCVGSTSKTTLRPAGVKKGKYVSSKQFGICSFLCFVKALL